MLGGLKKTQDSNAAKAATAASNSLVARDFLPVFTHYHSHTLVTKNGEVMQTLRISENKNGLNYEPHDRRGQNLRDAIRKALAAHIPGDHIAIWVHTLRKRSNVSFRAHYDHPFAAHVHAGWRAQNGWSHQYHNEVYVTLVYDGQRADLLDKALLKDGMTTKKNRQMRGIYLEAAANELDVMMEGIMDDLAVHYRVHRLELAERAPPSEAGYPAQPIFFSEPMEFLSYLINLRDEAVPLPDADISNALQSCQMTFGFNALETKSDKGAKRFGALLSLKHYREVPSHTVDMLLQAPMELIISQAFHFIPGEMALKEYRAQKEYFDMSGDSYSMKSSGLEEMLLADRHLPTDFGLQQTSIMVLVDELKTLDDAIGNLQKAFNGIGLVCVREDIRLEEMFWSMFPGNFVFLRRASTISTSRIGGFAKLNRFASGHGDHHFWQEPVALLPTLVNSPYFFHFHVQDNGHTLWLDCNSFNDTMSQRALFFLLTESQKLHPRIIYFDLHASAQLWYDKMQMPYHRLCAASKERTLSLNPFALEANPRNLGFLTAWCSELVDANAQEREQIKIAVAACYQQMDARRNLTGFVGVLAQHSPALAERFAPWVAGGVYEGFFAAEHDTFPEDRQWLGIDLTEAMNSPQNAVAAFALLLHHLILSLDGSPTIIVLQHALPILQQPFFAARLESLFEMLKENNAMLLLCARLTESLPQHPLMPMLLDLCASKVVVPDDMPLEYAQLFPALLSENDQDLLRSMARTHGDIMLKQGEETVALSINLDHQPDVAAIFSNDVKTLLSAGGPFASIPEYLHAQKA